MGVELDYMMRNAVMRKGSIWFDNCDGCTKQYRCGTALYLLSNLSFANEIIVNWMVGAPGHGKGEVDSFNAIDKQFLLTGTASIVLPGVSKSCNRMAAEAMVNGISKSLAKECARLCSDSRRIEGVKSESKYKKERRIHS